MTSLYVSFQNFLVNPGAFDRLPQGDLSVDPVDQGLELEKLIVKFPLQNCIPLQLGLISSDSAWK